MVLGATSWPGSRGQSRVPLSAAGDLGGAERVGGAGGQSGEVGALGQGDRGLASSPTESQMFKDSYG